jgi:hypothetical protein
MTTTIFRMRADLERCNGMFDGSDDPLVYNNAASSLLGDWGPTTKVLGLRPGMDEDL